MSSEPLYLKRIYENETITLGPTDGTLTVARVAENLFPGGIDPRWIEWGLNVPAQPTGPMAVDVYEHIKEEFLPPILESVGYPKVNPGLTQHQIVDFCKAHQNKLRRQDMDWIWTIFPFRSGSKLVFAHVQRHSKGLAIGVRDPFSSKVKWDVLKPGYRIQFILPQLKPTSVSTGEHQ